MWCTKLSKNKAIKNDYLSRGEVNCAIEVEVTVGTRNDADRQSFSNTSLLESDTYEDVSYKLTTTQILFHHDSEESDYFDF